jgi:hypothetical protein
VTVIEKVKLSICERIFYDGNYNTELYKYAAEKVGWNQKVPLKIKQRLTLNSIQKNSKKSENYSWKMSFLMVLVSICLVGLHLFIFNQPKFFFEISR